MATNEQFFKFEPYLYLYARYLCSRAHSAYAADRPSASATIGYLVYNSYTSLEYYLFLFVCYLLHFFQRLIGIIILSFMDHIIF